MFLLLLLDTHFTFTYYVGIMFQLLVIFICFVVHLSFKFEQLFQFKKKIVTKISKIIKLKNNFFYYK